jgi:hypothetical protein
LNAHRHHQTAFNRAAHVEQLLLSDETKYLAYQYNSGRLNRWVWDKKDILIGTYASSEVLVSGFALRYLRGIWEKRGHNYQTYK